MAEDLRRQAPVWLATSGAASPATERRQRKRHRLLLLSFIFLVLFPTFAGIGYLYTRAADQYHSSAAFAIRSEEFANPLDALSAFTQTGASSAPDAEILHDFIQSQTLVEQVDQSLDIRSIFNRPTGDPVFELGEDSSIEDLLDYWGRMVTVSIDSTTGVLEVEVRAFDPVDARRILSEIIQESSLLIDELSRIAREDAMKFTLEDLAQAEERLKRVRRLIRDFRTQYQIIDPETDVESQIGVVAALQADLAEALVDYETVRSYSGENDLRLPSLQRRIDAIRQQIAAERQVVSGEGEFARPLSEIYGEYEELLVDLEFSERAYTAALAAEEQARFEARRKNRYLAVHVPPTLAEDSIYPDRELLALLIFVCSFAGWGVMVMIYYNIRDRR